MRYLPDTNMVSNLVRDPHGGPADRIKAIGEANICTSFIRRRRVEIWHHEEGVTAPIIAIG